MHNNNYWQESERCIRSSAALSGAAKIKKRKLQAQQNEAEPKKNIKISIFYYVFVQPQPQKMIQPTIWALAIVDDDQGKLT